MWEQCYLSIGHGHNIHHPCTWWWLLIYGMFDSVGSWASIFNVELPNLSIYTWAMAIISMRNSGLITQEQNKKHLSRTTLRASLSPPLGRPRHLVCSAPSILTSHQHLHTTLPPALRHVDAVRGGGVRLVPSCHGVVGGSLRQTGRQEGRLAHGQRLQLMMWVWQSSWNSLLPSY